MMDVLSDYLGNRGKSTYSDSSKTFSLLNDSSLNHRVAAKLSSKSVHAEKRMRIDTILNTTHDLYV